MKGRQPDWRAVEAKQAVDDGTEAKAAEVRVEQCSEVAGPVGRLSQGKTTTASVQLWLQQPCGLWCHSPAQRLGGIVAGQ